MRTLISISAAKNQLGALVRRAEAGDEVIITRRGRPAARLVPLHRGPIVFGDLAGLYIAEDLSLPPDILLSVDAFKSV